LNKQPSLGGSGCHLSTDSQGKFLLVANYNGPVTILPINNDGSLNPSSQSVQHTGNSVNKERQQGPHPHGVVLDHADKFLFVPDLGVDKIYQYQFDLTKGQIKPNENSPFLKIEDGSGPRHIVFHPTLSVAYVINELLSTITVCSYDSTKGILQKIQTISTLPPHFNGRNACAAIRVSKDGKAVFASNRFHDSITVFRVEQKGTLNLLQIKPSNGKTPRDINIDPSGKFLLIANQDSSSVTTFHIDPNTYLLNDGPTSEVLSPSSILFV